MEQHNAKRGGPTTLRAFLIAFSLCLIRRSSRHVGTEVLVDAGRTRVTPETSISQKEVPARRRRFVQCSRASLNHGRLEDRSVRMFSNQQRNVSTQEYKFGMRLKS